MTPKTSIYFDKKREIKSGEDKGRYHIKILLTLYADGKRQRFFYQTNIFATDKEFKQIADFKKQPKDTELKDKQKNLLELKAKADHILEDEQYLTQELFEQKFTSAGTFRDPLGLLTVNAEALRQAGRVGNAITFEQSESSLSKYAGGKLTFAQITPKWLQGYEKNCLDAGLSLTTVGIYLRPLRVVFNQERGKTIPHEMYPFRENTSQKGKYKIPTGKGRKMALTEDQKNQLLQYKSADAAVQKAVDFWIFSYFCNGMNFADICRLKVRQIENSIIALSRQKTVHTQRIKEDIVIPIRKEVRQIIYRWGCNSLDPDAYVFPVLSKELTENQIKDRIRDFISDTNDQLKIACEDLKIPVITTYWARHTFATISLRKGAAIEQIQEALGHADPKTTKAYLDGFDLETKIALSNKL